jgi:hypothetical protein
MRRRAFIAALGGAAVWPVVARGVANSRSVDLISDLRDFLDRQEQEIRRHQREAKADADAAATSRV